MNEFPSEAAGLLEADVNSHSMLDRIARHAVPGLADFCLIFLVDGANLRCVAAAHVTREGERLLRALNRIYRITRDDPVSTVARAVRTGRSQLRTEIAAKQGRFHHELTRVFDLHRRLAARSAVVVPIRANNEILGALTLSYSESRRTYGLEDLPLLERVADDIGRTVDAARRARAARRQAFVSRRARPALIRLRRAIDQLQAGVSRQERQRLLGEAARQERALSRILDQFLPPVAPRSIRSGRSRARL
jgi:GAF domain-containing protein